MLSLKHHSVPRKRIPRPKESSYITITPAKHTALQGLFQIKNVSIKECNNWLRRFTFYMSGTWYMTHVHCLDRIVMYDSPNCDIVLTILFYKLVEFGDQSRRVWSPKSTILVFKILRTRIHGCQNYIIELPEQESKTSY